MILATRTRTFTRTGDGHHLILAVIVGFVLRLAWGLWALRGTPEAWMLQGDQYSYWFFGNEIARGHGYLNFDGRVTSYYPVGFPAILSAVYWLGLHTPFPDNQARLTMCLQLVLSTASIVLAYFIARKVFNPRVALVTGWIVALFPSLIVGVATYSLETTFIFSALVCVAILVDHDWAAGPMTRRRLLWFGVALGASVLIRPFSTPIMLALGVAALCGFGWKSAFRHVGWAALTFALMLTPWTIRNEVEFNHFIPISTNVGDGLCMSRYPGSNGGFAWARHAWCADASLPEEERNPANTRAAIRFVLDHPTEELKQIPKRFFLMMGHDHGTLDEALGNGSHLDLPTSMRRLVNDGTDLYYHLTWMLAVAGLGLLFRGWRKDRLYGPRKAVMGITTLGLVVVPLTSWGNPRFHTPLLPFMAIMAASSIDWALSRWRPTTGDSTETVTAEPTPEFEPAI